MKEEFIHHTTTDNHAILDYLH